jgi:fatty-acid desaturase
MLQQTSQTPPTRERRTVDAPVPGDGVSQRVIRKRLKRPEATEPIRVYWTYAIALVLVHALALLAFIPWLFSWTSVIAAILGHFTFGMLGITVGYHRLLTHQGFTCPKWFEHFLAILGICTLQDSPARWVAIHRIHHKHSDEQQDPHSPLVSFFWGHMGWLFVQSRDHGNVNCYERYVRDLLKDPFYLKLERNSLWLGIYGLHALAFLVAGFLGGWAFSGNLQEGVRMGLSFLVWGVFVRTVFVMHGTWAVNSITHIWGYQNYRDTGDNSRNSFLIALISHGEGWHNNHHADQRAASHGHRWWEFDMSWWVIRGLECLGLANDVVRPRMWSATTDPQPNR